jgi:hypothetical protein
MNKHTTRQRAGQPPKWNDDDLWEQYLREKEESNARMESDIKLIGFLIAVLGVAGLIGWAVT